MPTQALIEAVGAKMPGIGLGTILSLSKLFQCLESTEAADSLFFERAIHFFQKWQGLTDAARSDLVEQMIQMGIWKETSTKLLGAISRFYNKAHWAVAGKQEKSVAEVSAKDVEEFLLEVQQFLEQNRGKKRIARGNTPLDLHELLPWFKPEE